ncbi:MAG: uroporphyrinogen decarboxylase family protein [Bacteroidales bacterium]
MKEANSRELVKKTLEFDNPSRVPRQCWLLPWAGKRYPEEASRLASIYPDDIIPVPGMYTLPQKAVGNRYDEGFYTDDWGCTFLNIQAGLIGVPTKPLIETWEQLDDFTTPSWMLSVDREQVRAFTSRSGKFTYSNSWIRPFERYQFIRTTELAMLDVALDSPEMKELIDRIHSHYIRETEAWADSDVDAIGIMDDWGMQNGMIVSPDYFRKYYKPLYRDYAEIAHSRGKYAFMHSDGNISEIIPDLIEVGIDAINSQLFCMDIEEIGSKYAGKITFWGEIDRQDILPNGGDKEIIDAVDRVHDNLFRNGGVIAQCEFGPAAKPENIFRVFEAWNKKLKTS